MGRQAHIDRVWHVIDKAGICMMTTQFDGGMRARPMEARPDKDAGVIWFFTRHRGLKQHEINDTPAVCLTFVYEKEKVYLSISGEAFVAHDPARARELWHEKEKRWRDGADGANLR